MPTLREAATALARQSAATLSDEARTDDLALVETPESTSDTHRETTSDGQVVRPGCSPLGLLDRSRVVDLGVVDRDVPRREILYDPDEWRFQSRTRSVRPLTDRGPGHGEAGVARLCEHLTARYEAGEDPE